MTPRWLLFFLFIVIVAGLGWFRQKRNMPQAGWRALTNIAQNTRLTRDHVQLDRGPTPLSKLEAWDALTGRYAMRDFRKGDIIPVDALSNAPKIAQDKNHRILAYPLASLGAAASLINAGVTVAVCEGTTDDCVDGVVAAVSGDGESAAGVLLLTTADALKLGKIKQPQMRITSLP
jgi:hypothetical protein